MASRDTYRNCQTSALEAVVASVVSQMLGWCNGGPVEVRSCHCHQEAALNDVSDSHGHSCTEITLSCGLICVYCPGEGQSKMD